MSGQYTVRIESDADEFVRAPDGYVAVLNFLCEKIDTHLAMLAEAVELGVPYPVSKVTIEITGSGGYVETIQIAPAEVVDQAQAE